jgi:hypothetical protein
VARLKPIFVASNAPHDVTGAARRHVFRQDPAPIQLLVFHKLAEAINLVIILALQKRPQFAPEIIEPERFERRTKCPASTSPRHPLNRSSLLETGLIITGLTKTGDKVAFLLNMTVP